MRMNTKLIMTLSAVALAVTGITLTFFPAEISHYINPDASKSFQIIFQILGALYFAFAMLNWMAKESTIGGIYNRPIAIANFTHFLIGGLALDKALLNNADLPAELWIAAVLYSIFAVLFALILFRPISKNKQV